jgi:hypothetical protein
MGIRTLRSFDDVAIVILSIIREPEYTDVMVDIDSPNMELCKSCA